MTEDEYLRRLALDVSRNDHFTWEPGMVQCMIDMDGSIAKTMIGCDGEPLMSADILPTSPRFPDLTHPGTQGWLIRQAIETCGDDGRTALIRILHHLIVNEHPLHEAIAAVHGGD